MRKPFISQNIRKETSRYSIQLCNVNGGYWEGLYPFKNVVRYNTSDADHLPGDSMLFRIWPVVDPNYLELRYAGGSDGTFYWKSTKGEKSIIYDDSILYCPGSFNAPFYCSFNIYSPVSSPIVQILELEVFLGGEDEEFISLGTLCLTHNKNLSKKYTCT